MPRFSLPWARGRAPVHLGVAIGKHWINLCLAARRGDGFEVRATRILTAAERPALGRVVAEMGARGAGATFSLVDRDFHHRTVTVPALGRRDLARVVAREAGAQPGDAVAWTPRRARPDGMHDVEVRAMPRAAVLELAREAVEAGLVLVDVVPHAASFINAMTRQADRDTDALLSLLEVWEHNADLILTRSGAHVYDRHMNRGALGRRGEEAPAPPPPAPSLEDMDFGEIDLAFDLALGPDGDASGPTPPPESAPAPEAPPPAAPPGPAPTPTAWERLAEEIHRTHLYARKNLKAGEVARVILTGPVADDPAFVSWLSAQVRADVVPYLEYRSDVAWRGDPDPRMVVAMGAALGGLARPPRATSLVPDELRRRDVPAPFSHAAAALLVFALVSAGMGVVYQARAVGQEQAQVAALRDEVARARNAHGVPRGPTPLVTPDGGRHALPDDLPGSFPAVSLLADLGAAMPAEARLLDASAAWKDGAWRVTARGEVLAPGPDALRAVGALVEALAATGRFRAVDLSPVRAGEFVTRFSLTLTVDGAGRAHPA